MNVERAYEEFKRIKEDLPLQDDDREITDNEASTRLHLIDPLLSRVLGWSNRNIKPEISLGKGRVDYLLYHDDGVCSFVIEAKKRTVDLLNKEPLKKFRRMKLSGPSLKDVWKIISGQMAGYLGVHMPNYGAVTNGEQWIGFLAVLRPRDTHLSDLDAAVFRSLDEIEKNFEQFYELFSCEGARRRKLQILLAPESARGAVHCPAPTCVVRPAEEKPLSYQQNEPFYQDLRRAMDLAFLPIQDDPEALEKCFVESRESKDADSRLERLAAELTQALRDAPSEYPVDVRQEIGNVRRGETDRADLPPGKDLQGKGYIARIIGEPTAGKSVFLKRLFASKLKDLRNHIVLIWVDCEELSPFEERNAGQRALEQLKRELCGEEGPEWTVVREVYRNDWNAYTKLYGVSSNDDDERQHRINFLESMQRNGRADPLTAFGKWADFSLRNRRKLPCIVIDNVDHLDVAKKAAAWTTGIHRSCFALTTIALDDTTLWRLRKQQEDQLSKLGPESFWLHKPKIGEVLENRLDFLAKELEKRSNKNSSSLRSLTHLGWNRQWKWSVDTRQLAPVLSRVLIEDKEISGWIAKVCNFNIREVLELCKRIALSPHVRSSDMFCGQVIERPPSRWRAMKAIIAPTSEQFQDDATDIVMNIFGFWLGQDWVPLMPGRLLAFLRETEKDERNRKERFPGFVGVKRIEGLFECHLGIPRHVTKSVLVELVDRQLLETFDPSNRNLCNPGAKVRVTPRGSLHLDWALTEPTYVRMMAEVDSLVVEDVAQRMRESRKRFLENIINKAVAREAEFDMIEIYVSYVLSYGRKVGLATDASELGAVKSFEQAIRGKWCGDQETIIQETL